MPCSIAAARSRDDAQVTIDELLADARAELGWRPRPDELAAVVAAGGLLVDIRPFEQRGRDGALPGALVIDRNVLEWRLDPASPNRVVDVKPEQAVVVVCNEGYASSLAAVMLRRLGLRGATDLDGGFQAWLAQRNG
jgi:rhodanese-related sulfurtransferase